MNIIQPRIKRVLAEPESIDYVRGLLEINVVTHRTELEAQVCERFGFRDALNKAFQDLKEGLRDWMLEEGDMATSQKPSFSEGRERADASTMTPCGIGFPFVVDHGRNFRFLFRERFVFSKTPGFAMANRASSRLDFSKGGW